MAAAPTPTTSAPNPQETGLKVADVSGDTVFLKLDDGRHIAATVKEGVEGVKRGAKVSITSDGLDKEGAPKDAVVVKVQS